MTDSMVAWDTTAIRRDMAARGWMATDLARASGKHASTVTLFLRGLSQTPKTAAAIARAMGYSPRRYLTKRDVA